MTLRRIIWHSNAPWLPTGYGTQTALFVPRLRQLGYEVIVSSFAGLLGAPLEWDGLTILPAGQDPYGSDTIPAHHYHAQADLTVTLLDVWALQPQAVKSVPLACWVPIDTEALGDGDRGFFEISGAIPIAMSRHGERLLRINGYDPLYVPHGIDTAVFAPRADRDELRERAGLAGKFTVAIVAANKDAIRKCFFPQFEAFARFRRRHCPEAQLLVHTLIANQGGLDIKRMAQETGIEDAVHFSSQYKTLMGLFKPADIATLLNTADVLTNTAMGEGFGLTPLEALSCGVPTITTRSSAMIELSLGDDWLADGDPFWNPTHAARWVSPFVDSIVDRYCFAYNIMTSTEAPLIRQRAREHALPYDASLVTEQYWRPALTELDTRLEKRKAAASVALESGAVTQSPLTPGSQPQSLAPLLPYLSGKVPGRCANATGS